MARDFNLDSNWLNAAVGAQWKVGLPDRIEQDIEWRSFRALSVGLVGRRTLLALKLFAATDRGFDSVHSQDLLALAPDEEELERAREWVESQDVAPEWPRMVAEIVAHVRRR